MATQDGQDIVKSSDRTWSTGEENCDPLIPNRKRSMSRLYIVTPFNLYAECNMRNAGLEEAQAEIRIARRNTSNLRYADDTTLMAESEEELKSLLMEKKEESEKAGLKLSI